MKFEPILCNACLDTIVLGQALTWARFTTIAGPGGHHTEKHKWLIHNRKECKDKVIGYEQKNNWS